MVAILAWLLHYISFYIWERKKTIKLKIKKPNPNSGEEGLGAKKAEQLSCSARQAEERNAPSINHQSRAN